MSEQATNRRARNVHLVGSIPAASAEESYGLLADELGDTISPWVPDGETGERSDWVVRLIDRLRDHPALELVKDGSFGGYEDTPIFKVRRGQSFEWVELDYTEEYRRSRPAFDETAAQLQPGTAFQVGVPGAIDLAMIAFGFDARRGLRHIGPFRDATVRELVAIDALASDSVVFQLEIPLAVGAVYRAPARAASALSRMLAKETVSVVRRGPLDARYGLHFCNGDMNNEAMVRAENLGPLVTLTNAIVAAWPQRRALEFIHLPFGGGVDPAPVDADYYAPLAKLKMPASTRLIAGFVHEADDLSAARSRLATIESIVGHEVDVAAPCGLGRRSIEAARANLSLSKELVSKPS